jgi:hypothetical protein
MKTTLIAALLLLASTAYADIVLQPGQSALDWFGR